MGNNMYVVALFLLYFYEKYRWIEGDVPRVEKQYHVLGTHRLPHVTSGKQEVCKFSPVKPKLFGF